MLELYNFPMSTCSQTVRIVLAEKGLEWKDHRIESGEHLRPEYLKLNANGVVPTLIHDGVPIIDSSVICEYLDEVFPNHSTTPSDAFGRAHMRAWLRYIEEVPTPAVRYPSFNRVLVRNLQRMSKEEFACAADKRPLRKHFYHRMGQGGFPKEDLDAAFEELGNAYGRMEQALQETGGPWVLGKQFTLVDVCLVPTLDRMEDLGYAEMWRRSLPRVTEWWMRIKARPSYLATYYKGARFSDAYAAWMNESAPACQPIN
ncbi:MAG: glutathione S-transferase family protein [Betaproteobacteria bacterium]|nr:glutathione S-transferase family protein [Betaproteobacteria bacterium]